MSVCERNISIRKERTCLKHDVSIKSLLQIRIIIMKTKIIVEIKHGFLDDNSKEYMCMLTSS